MPLTDIVKAVQQLSSDELRELLDRRAAEDKALKSLLRAAAARERAERQRHAAVATQSRASQPG